MILSRCCKDDLEVVQDYYVCVSCGKSCDTVFVLSLETDRHDDSRTDHKVT
jgi:hypothetical protein